MRKAAQRKRRLLPDPVVQGPPARPVVLLRLALMALLRKISTPSVASRLFETTWR